MIDLILKMNVVGVGIIAVIVIVFILALIAMSNIKRTYAKITSDITTEDNRQKQVFSNRINNDLTADFKQAIKLRVTDINTPAIVDKQLNAHLSKTHLQERFVSKAPGMMIVLGIVGTFFGLTLSIAELVDLLSNSPEATLGEVTNITTGLLNAINGMAVAFITSLFGIGASILFNAASIFTGLSESKDYYTSAAEEYLDNVLGHKTSDMTLVDEHGRTPIEIAFEELGERLSGDLRAVSEGISYKLTVASNSMKETADTLDKSLDRFDEAVENFSKNTRDFSEFNHQLKNNIQRMSIAFDDVTQKLKSERK